MSFGRPDDAQLVAALLDDPKAQPIVSLLAEMDGTAIGHVLFPNAAVEGDRVRVPASLLAPLAVIPDAQRRGVGQAHIAAGIDTLAALGIGLVFVMRSWSAENGTIDHRLRQERPIMRLLHTMIRVGDLDRSIAFYTDVLRMKLLRRKDYPEGKFTLAFVGYGDEASNSAIELTYNWGVNQYELGSGFGHIALEVDDVHRAADEIRQRGGKILREAGPMNAGTTIIAFVADPDGYPIELIGRRS